MSRKLGKMDTCGTSLKEVWEWFIISKTSKCVSDATLSNYRHHLRGIGKHLNIEMPLAELSKRDLERMVVSMKEAGLAHNTIATYLRVMNTFLQWCQGEGLTDVVVPVPAASQCGFDLRWLQGIVSAVADGRLCSIFRSSPSVSLPWVLC